MTTYRREVVAATVAAAVAIIGFNFHPSPIALWWTFIPSMVIAYVCHLASTARRPTNASRVLPIYLVALAWQFVHFAEEFQGGFHRRWTEEIFGAPAMSAEFFVWANMASYAVFTLAAVAVYVRVPVRVPMLIIWFFTIMGVLGNAVGHAVYSILTGDLGFPGFYTSLAYWVIGPILIHRLWSARAGGRTNAKDERRDRHSGMTESGSSEATRP